MRAELSALPANRLIPDMGSVWSWEGKRDRERERESKRAREQKRKIWEKKYGEQICYDQIQCGRLRLPRTPGHNVCPIILFLSLNKRPSHGGFQSC